LINREKFYSAALPTSGTYCITTIDKDEPDEKLKAKNHFADDLTGFFKTLDKALTKGFDTYAALSSFKSHSRKAAQGAYSRSLFVDLDIGEESYKYPDKSQALVGLNEFIRVAELPPPITVDSGTGIHGYWIFDKDIEIETWKLYSSKFKKHCQNLKFLIDPVCTADIARIMRVPESLNYKTNPASLSRFLDPEIYIYDFELFKDYLDAQVPSDARQILLTVANGELDADTKAVSLGAVNFESEFQIIAERSLGGSQGGCAQIKQILENAATLSEPFWRAGLSIAEHCVDRDTAIHLMSEDYPGYDWTQTETKAKATHDKPYSCVQFDHINPGGCTGCLHRGRITNPLALGRKLKGSSSSIHAEHLNGHSFVFPPELKPFVRGQHGGIYYVPPYEVDDEGATLQEPPLLISEHDIYPLKRIYNHTDGECMLVRFVTPNDDVREFNVPTRVLHAKEELIKQVAQMGVTFDHPVKSQHFMTYMIKWSQHLLNIKQAELMRMQMGWTDDYQGFVVGNVEYRRDGTEIRTASSPLVHSISRLLRAQGDFDLWKRSVSLLGSPGFETHAFALLCGLGSPLMRLTSTAGISVGFVGGSGFGKTGALYAGLSLFGNPKELSLAGGKEQATANGLIGWFMGLKNLMLGLDESSNRKPEELSNLIHQISQGKGKIRMQASVNAVRDLEQAASMIAIFTSNQAIYDKLHILKASPDGEMARIVELNLGKPQAMKNDEYLGERIFDVFRGNYGHGGPIYIKKVLELGDEGTKNVVDKWIVKFTLSKFGKDSTFRFYENLIGATFGGGEIARLAGLIDWDLDRIFNKLIGEICELKDNAQINQLDMEAVLGEFQNRHLQSTLFMDKGQVVGEPKLNLVSRAEIDKKTYYASAKEFKKYLNEAQISIREFLYETKQSGLLVFEGKQRMTQGWSAHSSASPVLVWGFKYEPGKLVI